MTAGVHFERTEAYVPVRSWTTIKLQVALTTKHRFGLRAFDYTAAYLQAELKGHYMPGHPKDCECVTKGNGRKTGTAGFQRR